ncbi:hypothetical protein MBLNU459_g3317t1 [Dothideomycetes sp. NU459]
MSNPPRLQVTGLPGASAEETSATASPARGREMRANLLSKLRPPPLVHAWDFWHDRQNRNKSDSTADPSPLESDLSVAAREQSPDRYEDRLVHLASVADVRAFWNVFNNFDIRSLPLRDSVHLFHRGVKPVWEDPRNARGGAWTFRIPKEKAEAFWKEICMLAIGEQLQAAVASTRVTFLDDVCGVSLSVRFTSILVQIWNRDASHKEGIQNLLSTVRDNVSPDLQPKANAFYYKAHHEHAGFHTVAPAANKDDFPSATSSSSSDSSSRTPSDKQQEQTHPSTDHRTGKDMPRPQAAHSMRDITNTDTKNTRNWPTFSRVDPAGVMHTDNPAREAEARAGIAAPGTGSAVPKGSGFISQDEAVQDVKDTLGSMKEAMNKVAEKDAAIQEKSGVYADEYMTGV